jgi:hypothetical protein
MWAFVLRWLRFPKVSGARPTRLKADPAPLRQSWNGTVLSTESYR